MSDFDPDKFEEKYVHYFPELQRAYKQAFETMNDQYDSTLIHAIDQQVLNESEPFYADGEFSIALPDDPFSRLQGVVVEKPQFEAVLEEYVRTIETFLAAELLD